MRVYSGLFPRVAGGKRSLAVGAAAVGLAVGCSGGDEEVRTVRASGFTFTAPSGWDVKPVSRGLAAAGGSGKLVAVYLLPLQRAFRTELWPRVVRELDRSAARIAVRLNGRVEKSRTVEVAGRRARQYELAYQRAGDGLRQRITFILEGKREYELLCRWKAGEDEPRACGLLLESFRLAR